MAELRAQQEDDVVLDGPAVHVVIRNGIRQPQPLGRLCVRELDVALQLLGVGKLALAPDLFRSPPRRALAHNGVAVSDVAL